MSEADDQFLYELDLCQRRLVVLRQTFGQLWRLASSRLLLATGFAVRSPSKKVLAIRCEELLLDQVTSFGTAFLLLIRTISDQLYQAVGWHRFVQYDGIGHGLPKHQSFALRKLQIEPTSYVVQSSPFESVRNHSWLAYFETRSETRDVHRIYRRTETCVPSLLNSDSSCNETPRIQTC